MSEKFRDKYRIPSTRLQEWDYSSNGSYFITICTLHHEHYFGEVNNGKMKLTLLGHSAYHCWNEIPNHFPFVILGNFVVMPNHVHGIVIINKPNFNMTVSVFVETQNIASLPASTPRPASMPQPALIPPYQLPSLSPKNKFGPQSQNLASIIRGFKTGVTKFARSNNIEFQWQSRYYDHIIRDRRSFHTISDYITNNPAKWNEDKFKR